MIRRLIESDEFLWDLDIQTIWYRDNVDQGCGRRFFAAVRLSIQKLLDHPDVGRLRHFRHPRLQGLRSFLVARPFDRFLIFYRYDDQVLTVERLLYGIRDLPRRLLEPPDS